jgi:Tfp pilus assembly protein PilO
MTLSSLEPRRDAKLILAVLLVPLAINALVWFFVVRPRQAEARALQAERESFVLDYQAAKARTEGLKASWEKIQAAETGLRTFYDDMLGTKQSRLVKIEKGIESVAQEFGIDPLEVRYDSDDVVEGRVERFVVRMPLKGDYQDLRHFIARIESSEQFWVIDRISLSGTKEGGSLLQLSVDVATYFDAPWLADGKGSRRAGGGVKRLGR